jgi:surfactin synthase thioesterase subunit
VATAKYVLAMQHAPTVLVAHSYGAMLATEAWSCVQVTTLFGPPSDTLVGEDDA